MALLCDEQCRATAMFSCCSQHARGGWGGVTLGLRDETASPLRLDALSHTAAVSVSSGSISF
ncbi:hypothetical protein BKA66DRAFT_478543 [Pyrenochaeta sp. MPI-SDFR-AT-0127]|nr:hypothetical protein BKA66DRAFT_478543 [Pyrenochaeta sp. MPI-SDFR-AT-0127]